MPSNHYVSGQWNAICDVCGFKFKSSKLKKRWDGLMVCKDDFEHDHPQKFIRVQETGIAAPWVRDEPEPVYDYICYLYASLAYADLGEADCMRASVVSPTYAVAAALKAGT